MAIEVALRRGNPVTVNTPAERDLAAEAVTAAGLPLRRDMAPAMTGEDFAWYLEAASRRVRLDRQRPGRGWPRAAQFGLRLQRCDPAGRVGLSGQRREAGAAGLTAPGFIDLGQSCRSSDVSRFVNGGAAGRP